MDLVIYTDGSTKINPARVGFACVLTDSQGKQIIKLGTNISGIAGVKAAQALGIGIGLLTALRMTQQGDRIQVMCDNIQVGLTWHCILGNLYRHKDYIDSVPKQQRPLWGVIMRGVIQQISQLRSKQNRHIQFTWIRGHAGNPHNQMADKLAKGACYR